MKRGLLLLAMAGCVSTPPPKTGPKRLSKAKRDRIKARAGANFLDLEKRRKMKTKEERVRDIEENPPNLTTLRPRKEAAAPAPIRTKPDPAPAAEPAKPRGKPAWIMQVPAADGTYIYGMGMANIESDEGEARIQARDRAFAAIGSQLKVHVESVADSFRSSYTDQAGENLASNYDEAIRAHVDASLEGAEIHDQYSDEQNAYVLGRFNKAELEAKIAAQLAALQDVVLDQVQAAEKALAAGDSVKALGHGLRASLALRNLFGVPFQIAGRPAEALVNDLVARAGAGLQLSAADPGSAPVGTALTISAEVTSDGGPVDGVPVRFKLRMGPRSPSHLVTTRAGTAHVKDWRIWGRRPKVVVAVDMATLAGVDQGENSWLRLKHPGVVARLRLQMTLNLQPIRVRLSGSEPPSALREGLSKKLGMDLVDDSSAAWELELSIGEATCKDLSMRRTCKVRAQLTVRKQGAQRAQLDASGRGTQTDDDSATEQAEKRVGKRLVKALRQALSR
ncbi:MAG: hypothetical protein CMH55_02570 [Myxococcales bacterium]|nr:hypothetical protein [Myxococcales bacterium]